MGCAGWRQSVFSHAFLSAPRTWAVSDRKGLEGRADRDRWRRWPACRQLGLAESHSQGEYVFDHARAMPGTAGGDHYFELQIAVKLFTPATGSRLLLAGSGARPAVAARGRAALRGQRAVIGPCDLHRSGPV
ncbi:peptidogalycan biosysnthesis protein, partial [Novosphingobium sp.]|uniref:peptidogalycan biosysnthesis protein n=1 Tax=Novosphingobium sp. TaxID=1874826 RepID=UPI00341E15B9